MKNKLRTLCSAAVAIGLAVPLANAAPPMLRKPLPADAATAFAPQQLIVKYKAGTRLAKGDAYLLDRLQAAAALSRSASPAATVAPLRFTVLRGTATGARLVRASRGLQATEADALLAELRRDPDLQYAQLDTLKQRLDSLPNDPELPTRQWDLTQPGAGIAAAAAWDHSQGDGVIVAVLDTGYLPHRDLAANIVPGYDMIGWYGQSNDEPDIAGDGDGRDADATDAGDWTDASMPWCGGNSDSSWHGTHVAGTVAAVGNNGVDIAGVAYQAKLQPVRVLGHCGGLTSDIADAIVWAAGGHVDGVPDNATPAEVINMSLGGSGACKEDSATQEAIDFAISRGVAVVVAAGNSSADVKNFSPASCNGVVTVGASGVNGGRSYFSNYGLGVTLSAPGGNASAGNDPVDRWIWSLGDSGTTVATNDNALIGMIGTSQASPHVAGVVALMQAAAVGAGRAPLTPAQVTQLLRSTAQPFLLAPSPTTPMGAGILDAGAAVKAAMEDIVEDPATVLVSGKVLTGQTGGAGESRLYQIEVPSGGRSLQLRSFGGVGDVSLYASFGEKPSLEKHQRKSVKPGNSEAIVVNLPTAGTWYLRLVGEQGFSGVSVLGVQQ
ncbi:S8 family peptidase [Stenotrophomonas rhizophila]|uniref:S8 family peptidase n=1 Tax=Stenotrophomonas rhizophila TaxID=216778 RepID=UPI001E4E65E6|nr:S8 family peptidase [Stenotrophomonas rhizophila]MCC7632663.1 S8 family serine peptidase [Stenotrophomonas rhizophila]MCC7663515.1 S8 family serine peptidase [Stenotrophomonas rhizophila]